MYKKTCPCGKKMELRREGMKIASFFTLLAFCQVIYLLLLIFIRLLIWGKKAYFLKSMIYLMLFKVLRTIIFSVHFWR